MSSTRALMCETAMSVTVAAFVVSTIAFLLSGAAVVYARRTADAANRQASEVRRQADAAHEELRLAYSPTLRVTRKDGPAEWPEVLYEVRNDGRKDLDSVVVERPETIDRIRYPVARMGVSEDFEDQVELGPLRLAADHRLMRLPQVCSDHMRGSPGSAWLHSWPTSSRTQ